MDLTTTHQLEPLPGGGTRLHTRLRIKMPLPDRPARPVASALVKSGSAAKLYINLVRLLTEEFSKANAAEALASTVAE